MVDSATQTTDSDAQPSPTQGRLPRHAFVARPATLRELRRAQEADRRRVLGLRRQARVLHYGVVPEPHLTPLAAVNFLMDSLGVRRVTVAEARAAVARVTEHLSALSQTTPAVPQTHSAGAGSAARRRTRTAARAAAAAARPNSLGGESVSVLAALSASQVSLTQQSHGSLLPDIQDALVLEVLRELCTTRPLRLNRLSYRDQRRARERLSLVDVAPGRRVVVVADRRDPFFTLVLGAPSAAGDSDAASAIAFLTVANRPMPWRRLVVRNIPRFSHKVCAMAYVERVSEGEGEGGESHRRASPSPTPRRETVLLGLDDDEGDVADECSDDVSGRGASRMSRSGRVEDRDSPHATACSRKRRRSGATGYGGPWGEHDLPSSDRDDSVEGEGQVSGTPAASDIPAHHQLFFSAEPFFTMADGAGQGVADPFMRIPRVDAAGEHRNRRRSWVERLLPLKRKSDREATMAKLSRHTNVSY